MSTTAAPNPLPTVKLGDSDISRLIIGGNPMSGFSHINAQADGEMISYYTAQNIMKAWDAAWDNGINTIQTRGDRHMRRLYAEYTEQGGKVQWIAQTASELRDIKANIAQIAAAGAIAIYHHGTHIDYLWHEGRIDEARDYVKAIHDSGLPAGIGTHMPEVIRYIEEHGWETDFYMTSLYNLSRTGKKFAAVDADPYSGEAYLDEDRDAMSAIIKELDKPCLAFKLLAAGRNASSPEDVKAAFRYAFENIKPEDAVVVGVFQRDHDEIAENAAIVRSLIME